MALIPMSVFLPPYYTGIAGLDLAMVANVLLCWVTGNDMGILVNGNENRLAI
jgi:hypothetical protein